MEKKYRKTLFACCRGYITQAIVVNLAPLFFVIFRENFGLSLVQIAQLISINFAVQIAVDIIAIKYADKIGYRACILGAHALVVVGLLFLGLLPFIMPPYAGLIIATVTYAAGSGVIEVLISPIVDNLPSDAKASSMSFLHSFYSWGQMLVILFTTVAILFIGKKLWFILPVFWALLPLYNLFSFISVTINEPGENEGNIVPLRKLLHKKMFIIALFLMVCAGASELVMSQWASMFAEKGLGVSKVMGDILGPCLFAVFMGIGRTIYGVWGKYMNLRLCLIFSSLLAIICYILTVFSGSPIIALMSCSITGLSVSLMWPGMLSLTSERYRGGTAMFGTMAVFGDIGCTIGPMISGLASDITEKKWDAVNNIMSAEAAGLRAGLLIALIFPLGMLIGTIFYKKKKENMGFAVNTAAEKTPE